MYSEVGRPTFPPAPNGRALPLWAWVLFAALLLLTCAPGLTFRTAATASLSASSTAQDPTAPRAPTLHAARGPPLLPLSPGFEGDAQTARPPASPPFPTVSTPASPPPDAPSAPALGGILLALLAALILRLAHAADRPALAMFPTTGEGEAEGQDLAPALGRDGPRIAKRVVFGLAEWRRHRSESRFFRGLATFPASTIMRNITPTALIVMGTAAVLCWSRETYGVPMPVPPAIFAFTAPTLALLLAFRTNASYERFDGGRKLLASARSRSEDLTRQVAVRFPGNRRDLKEQMLRYTQAFFFCLKVHLRGGPSGFEDDAVLVRDLTAILEPRELDLLLAATNRPAHTMLCMTQAVHRAGLQWEDLMTVDKNLTALADVLGGCERILRTPVPLSYSQLTYRLVKMWLLLLPAAFTGELLGLSENAFLAIPSVGLTAFLLLGIEELTRQIEEPFSLLPMEAYAEEARLSTASIFEQMNDTAFLIYPWQLKEELEGRAALQRAMDARRARLAAEIDRLAAENAALRADLTNVTEAKQQAMAELQAALAEQREALRVQTEEAVLFRMAMPPEAPEAPPPPPPEAVAAAEEGEQRPPFQAWLQTVFPAQRQPKVGGPMIYKLFPGLAPPAVSTAEAQAKAEKEPAPPIPEVVETEAKAEELFPPVTEAAEAEAKVEKEPVPPVTEAAETETKVKKEPIPPVTEAAGVGSKAEKEPVPPVTEAVETEVKAEKEPIPLVTEAAEAEDKAEKEPAPPVTEAADTESKAEKGPVPPVPSVAEAADAEDKAEAEEEPVPPITEAADAEDKAEEEEQPVPPVSEAAEAEAKAEKEPVPPAAEAAEAEDKAEEEEEPVPPITEAAEAEAKVEKEPVPPVAEAGEAEVKAEEEPVRQVRESAEAESKAEEEPVPPVAEPAGAALSAAQALDLGMDEALGPGLIPAPPTPASVVLQLQRGNCRFWMGIPSEVDQSPADRWALVAGQNPMSCVLACSDSRVPVELIFDQGMGDMYVVRVAGIVLDRTTFGSIELAVQNLGVRVLMVLGHEGCGTVRRAVTLGPEEVAAESPALQSVIRAIRTGIDVDDVRTIVDVKARDREAVVRTVMTQVTRLQQNPVVAERVADGSLLVCGAFYELSSGIVDFFSLDRNGFITDL